LGQPLMLESELRARARSIGGDRPAIVDTSIDWDAVETARVAFQVAERPGLPIAASGSEDERSRQDALIVYYRDRQSPASTATWSRCARRPMTPTELAMVADAAVDADAPTAEADIEALRAFQPVEADTILATLRLRQGRLREAGLIVERALLA